MAPSPPAEPEVRAIWVDSFNPGLRSPEEVDALIARVRRANINTIVAQVRRNAQSLYAISIEGWAESYVPPLVRHGLQPGQRAALQCRVRASVITPLLPQHCSHAPWRAAA
jgi:uncharacterized lipoprotein YddW (UPF0748 family)